MPIRAFTLYIMFFAGIGGVLYGYDIGVIAGALLFIEHDIVMSAAELSFIVAAVLGGGSIATLISGYLSDRFGRKRLILIASLVFVAGILILLVSNGFGLLLTGRLIQGVGIGILTIVIPLYIVETMPARYRGRGVAIFQAFLTVGIAIASFISLSCVDTGNWRAMFAISLIPAVILIIGGSLLPESPRWLFSKGKTVQARSALLCCGSREQAEIDFSDMNQLAATHEIEGKEHYSLFHRHYIFPFLLARAIACLNQLTGINSLLQFSTYIIHSSGISSYVLSMVGTLGITLTNFLTTLLAFFLVDRIGRRPLMLVGTLGMTMALFVLGVLSGFFPSSHFQGYAIIAGMIIYIFMFAIGPGIIVWLVLSELLPTEVRGTGMAICLFMNSLASTVLASGFLTIAHHIGYIGDFWLCALCTLLYFYIVLKYLPESKAKTLEEIEAEYKQRWLSKK